MKITRFEHFGEESYGILENDKIVDLLKIARLTGSDLPQNIDNLIFQGERAVSLVETRIRQLSKDVKNKVLVAKAEVSLKAPIISPPKIICLGLNYCDHAVEGGMRPPDEPIIFMKPRTALVGPEEEVVKPHFVKELDYEVELAVIIGSRCKNIPISSAHGHIFGYTVLNDISARDIQFKDGQWTRGKSFDTFAPLGPWIVTPSEIDDPNNLQMWTRVNNEVRQNSSTSNMIFNVYEIIHHLSRVMTLEPCDIIATGTPAGVAAFMKPERKFLMPGDIVDVTVEKIGTLRNKIQQG